MNFSDAGPSRVSPATRCCPVWPSGPGVKRLYWSVSLLFIHITQPGVHVGMPRVARGAIPTPNPQETSPSYPRPPPLGPPPPGSRGASTLFYFITLRYIGCDLAWGSRFSRNFSRCLCNPDPWWADPIVLLKVSRL